MGNDNEGGLTLTYGLEDIDRIGDKDVFNAADSVLFCNVRDCFPDRLKAMFQQMESAGAWNAQRLLDEMDAYQAIKPERLWVKDMRRKYLRPYEELGDASFLEMLNGTKTLQRAQFELYQEDYCASKYISANCTSDQITLRAYKQPDASETKPVSITLTMYSDCYVVIRFGSHTEQKRVKRGEETTITYAISMLNDTETYICTASRVQSIGNLADIRVGYCAFANAVKLQSLVISPYDETYSNTNFNGIDLSNCAVLKSLEICGCPNLATAVSFEGCPRLETVDLRNTSVTGVSFATGGYLQSAYLPETIVGITAIQLTDWSVLTMPSYENVQNLHLEYCNSLDSYNLVRQSTNLTRLRLIDINWTMETSQLLIELAKLSGKDDTGNDSAQSVITGKVYVSAMSLTRYAILTERFMGLEISYDEVAPEYTVRFLNHDGSALDTQIVEHGFGAEDPVTRADNPIPTPVRESTAYYEYTYTGWSNLFVSVLQDMDIYATYSSALRTYVVRWMNGVEVLEEDTVTAGESAEYNGKSLSRTGYIWTGFDKSADVVLSNMDIKAVWTSSQMPSSMVDPDTYDYIYSDKASDSSGYTLEEFVAIIESGLAGSYFEEYGKIKIVMDTDLVTDTEIVFSLHSTGHYKLEGTTNFAKTTWYMIGLLNQNRVMSTRNTNAGGYFSTDLDGWVEDELYNSLPYHWRSIIKPVTVLANIGSQNQEILSATRHMYLPAAAELGITPTSVPYSDEIDASAKEVTFTAYPATNSGNEQRKKGKFNNTGEAAYYWTRSAHAGSDTDFYAITTYGSGFAVSPTVSYSICVGMSI